MPDYITDFVVADLSHNPLSKTHNLPVVGFENANAIGDKFGSDEEGHAIECPINESDFFSHTLP